MIPNFETAALHTKARALTHPMPHAGSWALASLSLGIGVGTTSFALYATDQQLDDVIATVLWCFTAFFFVLAGVLWRLKSQAADMYSTRVNEFCDEIKMLVRRYGGETAEAVVEQLEQAHVLPERKSLLIRLRLRKPDAVSAPR